MGERRKCEEGLYINNCIASDLMHAIVTFISLAGTSSNDSIQLQGRLGNVVWWLDQKKRTLPQYAIRFQIDIKK